MRPLLLLLLVSGTALADGAPISGVVTDNTGKPLENIQVGAEWSDGDGRFQPFQYFKTDAEGRYEGGLHWRKPAMVLMAIDTKRTIGAAMLIEEATVSEPRTFRLEPLVRVTGSLECEAIGDLGPTTISVEIGGIRALKVACKAADFSFLMPPGEFELVAFAWDAEPFRMKLSVPAGKPAVDLGKLALTPTIIARHWGKPPPELQVSEARGADPRLKLSSLNGKHVLIVFWSAQNAECVRGLFPRLRAIYEAPEAKRDGFEILAVHDAKVGTLAELDKLMEKAMKGSWGGKPMPFPLLMDKEGKTAAAYGVTSYPTFVLLDREGNVVRKGAEKEFAEAAGK